VPGRPQPSATVQRVVQLQTWPVEVLVATLLVAVAATALMTPVVVLTTELLASSPKQELEETVAVAFVAVAFVAVAFVAVAFVDVAPPCPPCPPDAASTTTLPPHAPLAETIQPRATRNTGTRKGCFIGAHLPPPRHPGASYLPAEFSAPAGPRLVGLRPPGTLY
jgi:hypothetical protein